jgi:hypothetical protein
MCGGVLINQRERCSSRDASQPDDAGQTAWQLRP